MKILESNYRKFRRMPRTEAVEAQQLIDDGASGFRFDIDPDHKQTWPPGSWLVRVGGHRQVMTDQVFRALFVEERIVDVEEVDDEEEEGGDDE